MRTLVRLGFTLLIAAPLGIAQAQSSEAKRPLTIIVSTTPGTGGDITARVLASSLQEALGQSVVVENRTGASGAIGIAAAAKAPPDGNTVLFVPNTIAMIGAIKKNLPFDATKSFEPVATVGKMLVAAVVNPGVRANTLGQLIDIAKNSPGQLNYGSPGSGTPHHLRAEQFKQITGVNILHVPYSGSAGAVTDLAGGQTQFGFFPLHSVLSLVGSGKLRLLATSGETRSTWTADVPTFRESGITELNNYDWIGAFVPSGTPKARVDTLSRAILAGLANPKVQEQLVERGIIPNPGGPAELAALMRKELNEWKQVAEKGHIVAE